MWVDRRYSIDEIAEKLHKSRPSTHYQAWKMGLRRPQVWKFWTKEETRYLKKNYKKKTYEQIARDLGMTRNAVSLRAQHIGLRKQKAGRPLDKRGRRIYNSEL